MMKKVNDEKKFILPTSRVFFISKKELKDHASIYTEDVCDCVFAILEGESGVLLYHRFRQNNSQGLEKYIENNFNKNEQVKVTLFGGSINGFYINKIKDKLFIPVGERKSKILDFKEIKKK